MVTFAHLLRRFRLAAGLSQEELAERAHLSREAISTLERGTRSVPRQATITLLADTLQLSPTERAQWEVAARGQGVSDPLLAKSHAAAGGSGAASLRGEQKPHLVVLEPQQSTSLISGTAPQAAAQQKACAQLPSAGRHSLPIPPTALIGREQEVSTVCALLRRPEVRLLTLAGTAGVGKTRLALQVATDLSEAFFDGVQFVSLAAISDPGLVIPTLAQALGLREIKNTLFLTLLETALREQQMLLVLDNFEQVMAAAPHLAKLLEACADLKILVTSREVLHVRGEHQFEVAPLPVPSRSWRESHTPEALAENPALQLLLQRAQAVQPDVLLTAHNALSLTEICRLLEGIPLALELAAPRLKLLTPQALLVRLEGQLQILIGGARDLPERQRTMRATLTWSYDLLTPAEQALSRRLAVFVDGWTLAAAEQVCMAAGALKLDLLEGLASLLNKSLLLHEQTSTGDKRFRMLYVLREFGLERLVEMGELTATREAHAAYYLALAEAAEPHLRGSLRKVWLDQLVRDHENLRAALIWWLEQAHQEGGQRAAEYALRLCQALHHFWKSCHALREAHAFLERALEVRAGVAGNILASVVFVLIDLLPSWDHLERSEALAQESLALARQNSDNESSALALLGLGRIACIREQYTLARAAFEEAAALYQQTGNEWWRGVCLVDLADIALWQGAYERASLLLGESVALYQALDDQQRLGLALARSGWTLYLAQGDLTRAASLIEQGLRRLHEAGDLGYRPETLQMLGEIRYQQGKLAEARALVEEGLMLSTEQGGKIRIFHALAVMARLLLQQGEWVALQALYQDHRAFLPNAGYQDLFAHYLEGLGEVVAALGAPETAAQLWGAAEAQRETLGVPMFPVYRETHAQAIATARRQLGEAAFTSAWVAGRGMTPEQALAVAGQDMEASRLDTSSSRAPASPTFPAGLTPREVEVLRLLAEGLTNAQIAEQLVVSPLTVHTHLGNIYSKLGVTSRSAATRYALDHHLM